MSGIYIPGMEMPTEGFITVTITSDGRVAGNSQKINGKFEYLDNKDIASALPVPDHGRLINMDSKTFPTPHRNPSNDYMRGWNACLRSVQQQPTIIPADPADEEGEG